MENDDVLTGRLLSRREAVELFGVGAVSVFLARGLPSGTLPAASAGRVAPELACIGRPEMTEGPFFVDHQLERSDIRAEPGSGALSKGVPLAIAFSVSSVANNACTPIQGAIVDVWHCDAAGVYSGVDDRMAGTNTVGKKFLRGFQTADKTGMAQFATVYPGWYQGRAVHVHFKIRTIGVDKKAYEFTSQLFFDDALSDALFKVAPYNKPGTRDTRNANDGIFADGGKQMTLALAKKADGYSGAINVGLDLTDAATGRADGMGAGGPGGRGRGRGGPPPGGRGRGPRPPG